MTPLVSVKTYLLLGNVPIHAYIIQDVPLGVAGRCVGGGGGVVVGGSVDIITFIMNQLHFPFHHLHHHHHHHHHHPHHIIIIIIIIITAITAITITFVIIIAVS